MILCGRLERPVTQYEGLSMSQVDSIRGGMVYDVVQSKSLSFGSLTLSQTAR